MLRLRDFLSRRGDPLQLEALTGDLGLDRQMPEAEVASPGLALAGYTGRFAPNRLHVFGETEITYLQSLPAEHRRRSLEKFFEFELPCIFVTKGQEVPPEMLELAGDPALVARLGAAARRFAERLTWERSAAETERHLLDIIAGSA